MPPVDLAIAATAGHHGLAVLLEMNRQRRPQLGEEVAAGLGSGADLRERGAGGDLMPGRGRSS
jgi:hypothetical protein